MNFDHNALLPYLSSYLSHGYREDFITLTGADFKAPRIRAYFRVDRFHPTTEGDFHLSATSAMNCICQAGVVYAGLDSGGPGRPGEIYLGKIDLRFREAIRAADFTVDLVCARRVERSRSIKYSVTGTVQSGCFELAADFVVPRTPPATGIGASRSLFSEER